MLNKKDEVYADIPLEKRILCHFMKDNTLGLRTDLFTTDEGRKLFEFVRDNWGMADTVDGWWSLWRLDLRKRGAETPGHRRFLQDVLREEAIPDDHVDSLFDTLKGFAEMRSLFLVYETSLKLAADGDALGARMQLEDGLIQLKSDFPEVSIYREDFVDGFMDRLKEYRRKKTGEVVSRIPTGIEKLDKRIGGVGRMTLNLVQGETNIGKTFVLQELAYQGFLRGLNVLFVSIELRGQLLQTRWDSRLTGVNFGKIDSGAMTLDEEKLWQARMLEVKNETTGVLTLIALAEGCKISSIEAELTNWENQRDKKIDLVVIDYLDLMLSDRRTHMEQEEQGAIARDLKRFCQLQDIVVWTATQVAGRSYGKSKLDSTDTGFSKKKGMWANLILGISANQEEQEDGILNMTVTKNTIGPKGFQITLYPDFSVSQLDLNPDG